jgi:hypothetical protein
VNSKLVGEVDITNFLAGVQETVDIGKDLGTAVSDEYSVPNTYNGLIRTVTVDIN